MKRIWRSMSWTVALPMIATIGLGVAGMAYAAWTSNLAMEGSVQTGQVGAIWDFATARQYVPAGSEPPPQPITIECNADVEPGDPAQQAAFSVKGIFPMYVCELILGARVTGSVPLAISGVDLTAVDTAGQDVLGTDISVEVQFVERDTNVEEGGGCDLTVPLPDDVSFAPGDGFCVVVGIQVPNASELAETFEVAMLLELVQWNLVPSSP